ncbi:lipopolysaccharide biosynthesis protein RfbH [Pelagibacteraceae bacterium]|nr:lipopolysaccharide biosynthesis protein RfbH [Pelagibacteraceae bacterium]
MNIKTNEIENFVKKILEEKNTKNTFIPGKTLIPPSGKLIGYEETKNMVLASLDGWLTTGRFNSEFQEKLSNFLKIKHLMTVNSGSSANLLIFSSLTSHLHKERAIMPGDEIISVAAGFPTTVNPIFQNGAIPVFIDIKLPTYNINEELIEDAITNKTKAIMLAHTLGNPFNIKKILEICKKNNLWLIEDNCDALGSKYNGQYTGTFGDAASLSFYPAHHITMGEGGAVFTNNLRIKRIVESFRDWGRDCYCETGAENTCKKRFDWQLGKLPYGYDHKYIYSHIGFNMKITDMQAACGLGQLKNLENFIQKRKVNVNFLKKLLEDLQDEILLPEAEINSDPSWFGFPITLKKESKFKRTDIIKKLTENKIGTRLLFAGNITKQPAYVSKKFKVHGSLETTDMIMANTFWVGIQPAIGEEELSYIAKILKEFFKK